MIMSTIERITLLYFIMYICFENDTSDFRTTYGWFLSRCYQFLDSRVKLPTSHFKRRLIGDVIRCYFSSLLKMAIMSQIDYVKLSNTIPYFIILVVAVYSLSYNFVIKKYKENRLSICFFTLEYQYLKCYAYIKYTTIFINVFNGSLVMALIAIDICEGMATNSTYIIENYLFKEKISFDSIIRNLKMYGVLNAITLIYYSYDCNMNNQNDYVCETGSIKNLYETLIYSVMFLTACSKIQLKFEEIPILQKLAENLINFGLYLKDLLIKTSITVKNTNIVYIQYISKNGVSQSPINYPSNCFRRIKNKLNRYGMVFLGLLLFYNFAFAKNAKILAELKSRGVVRLKFSPKRSMKISRSSYQNEEEY